jgi:hypothetical protein
MLKDLRIGRDDSMQRSADLEGINAPAVVPSS